MTLWSKIKGAFSKKNKPELEVVEDLESKLQQRLERLLKDKGVAYSVAFVNGTPFEYLPNLNQVAVNYNIPKSSLYKAIEDNGIYKNEEFEVKEWQKY